MLFTCRRGVFDTLSKFCSIKHKPLQPLNFRKYSSSIQIFNRQDLKLLQNFASRTPKFISRMSSFLFPKNQPVVQLDCEKAFNELTDNEKLYAHYLSQAAWYGGLIVLVQTSPESPLIFQILHKLFKSQPISELKEVAIKQCNFTEDEFQALLIYTSGFLCNMGNYKGFGDTKFIPDVVKDKIEVLLKVSQCYKDDSELIQNLWNGCNDAMFSLSSREKQLGLGDKGVTTYFSENCTAEDSDVINKFLIEKSIEAYNNRAFKVVKDGKTSYEIRLASSLPNGSEVAKEMLGIHTFDGFEFKVTRGDYSGLLALVSENLKKAKEFALNDNERNMLSQYIESFETGSLDAHKNGSRFWIKDKGPIIETYIGFIETYRDPVGMRAEFEGFVAMVNKKMSEKFAELVDNAETFLPLLPWPSEYEKDKFLRPDFTSLDVLTFAGSGIPAGINIPNYDEIRQNEGFKNVSLGNVIPASYKDSVMPFLTEEDQTLLSKYRIGSFEIQVGLHELLGHGSGKLFTCKKGGECNFDRQSVKHLETGELISKCYEDGETYDSKFTNLGSAYEECRAECVGLHLCVYPKIQEIFGYKGEEGQDVSYVNWLSMVWKGLLSLEMYQPESQVWLQAHSQARFVILNVLLEAGKGFTEVKEVTDSMGKPSLLVTMDKKKIDSVGRKAISDFLKKLQVYKSTGDDKSGRELFNRYAAVNNDGKLPFLSYRDIVMVNKQPRKMFVQANTTVQGNKVTLKNYEANHPSLIQSWVDRFSSTDVDSILQDLWQKDKHFFSS